MTDDAPAQREPSPVAPVSELGQLTLNSERDGDVHTISLTGELDIATADRVEQELQRVEAGDARSIVVDLAGLAFMDSNGVRLLLKAHSRSRENSNRLALRRGPATVQRVFKLSGVDDLLPYID